MNLLYVCGQAVEQKLGHITYSIFYLVCGVFATLTSWYFNNNIAPYSYGLGASGAIFGVLGADFLWFPKAKMRMIIPIGFFLFPFKLAVRYFFSFIIIAELFIAIFLAIVKQSDGINHLAHLGGFFSGFIIAFILTKLFTKYKSKN